MNFDNHLFRASGTANLMVKPKDTKEALSVTTKTYLSEVFVTAKYNRMKDVQTRYTTKGLLVEEDSLTLYSRYTKEFLLKNEARLSNDFICGTPDVILPDKIIDIKSSWDIFTFHKSANSDLYKTYYWQMQSYMALTGATKAKLAYCLIDTPEALINDEKRRLMWKMNVIDDANEDYQAACYELDRLMTYEDIPLNEKVFEIEIERNDEDIKRLYEKVIECRKYLNTL